MLMILQSFQNGQGYPNDSTLLVIDGPTYWGARGRLYHTVEDYGNIVVCMDGVIWQMYIRKGINGMDSQVGSIKSIRPDA